MPLPPSSLRPALFLDRDGLLNELVFYSDTGEWESPRCPEDLRLLPGAASALARLRGAGWPLFLVSNQPSFAKGKTTLEALKAVHGAFQAGLAAGGAVLDGAFYCYHHPDGKVPGFSGPCACRKPSPLALLEAAGLHGLDLARSWMVWDQDMDVLCGRNAGCRTILVPCQASRSKRGSQTPDHLCTDLADIMNIIGHNRGQTHCQEPPC